MKQNVYDNPEFFEGYMDLRSNENGLNVAIEEPAIHGLLPPLHGLTILDLGCGFGKFSAFCLKQGAAHVLGVDISQNMIAEAKHRIKDPRATFLVTPTEELEVGEATFDIVVSSMCFHYVKDIGPVFGKVSHALNANGNFIFSVEHPICTAMMKGWCNSEAGKKRHWPVDDYRNETIRYSNWFIDKVIKYHRTIETYVNGLLDAGLSIRRLLEPGPTKKAVENRPDLGMHLRRPPILVISSVKSAQPWSAEYSGSVRDNFESAKHIKQTTVRDVW